MEQKEFEFNGVAEISLSYRPNFKASQRPKVMHSRDCYRIFLAQWDLDLMELQEQFKVMLLNRANRVVGICELSKGGMSGTVADPKLVFALALKAGACAIVLVHNHPSGDLKPSSRDVSVTKKLCEGGKLLEVEVFDHLIISADGYLSMADEHYI